MGAVPQTSHEQLIWLLGGPVQSRDEHHPEVSLGTDPTNRTEVCLPGWPAQARTTQEVFRVTDQLTDQLVWLQVAPFSHEIKCTTWSLSENFFKVLFCTTSSSEED